VPFHPKWTATWTESEQVCWGMLQGIRIFIGQCGLDAGSLWRFRVIVPLKEIVPLQVIVPPAGGQEPC